MKKLNIFGALFIMLLSVQIISAQDDFSADVTIYQQFIKEDSGTNVQGILGYHFTKDLKLGIKFGNSWMESEDFDLDYNLQNYGLQANYSFAKSEKFQIESIFGFSYLIYDNSDIVENDQGLGIDMGIQTVFNTHRSFNYGLSIITTYNKITPGSIINAGAFLRLKL
ncbi:MAG: hypothetical protein ACJAT0_001859 [Nonlabens sp.]|jgi:hypothetical protein|uniref:outer membrane beta-barrel protein n=1 Tax=Nonlabens sp. TaxID=1888209 RepID=UPI0039E37A94